MKRTRTNIALIGFMGTGKTSVAEVLATRLGKVHVRTDSLIEEEAGKTIPQIFEQDGEKRFRELEMGVLGRVAAMKDVVIDCGGGVVLNQINIDGLKNNTMIVLLTSSPDVILERVSREGDQRPLLKTKHRLERIKKLLSSREPLYRKHAELEIDTSDLSVQQVAEKIIEHLDRLCSGGE